MIRFSLVAVGLLLLPGCAIPPALQLASLGANLVSYASSGKSLSDHGISYAVQKDCALHRAIDGAICQDESGGTVVADKSTTSASVVDLPVN